MKTTIDIPEALYKKVKIRAIERGQTLKQIVLTSLEKNLTDPATATATAPYFARRKLTPEFAAAEESGLNKLTPGTGSIEDIIAGIKDDVLL
jgi:hypothetical protein